MTPPIFAHGHLRLFILKLIEEQPRHGYELIQALSDRFDGAYAPSAGTIYPRLAKLEAEGLIRKEQQGRKTVYHVTDAGRAEVRARQQEIDEIEREAQSSMQDGAADARRRVSEAASRLRSEFAGFAKRAKEEQRESGEFQSVASELGQVASELGQMAAEFGRRAADVANAGWSAAEQARARGEDLGQAAGAGFRAAASSASGKGFAAAGGSTAGNPADSAAAGEDPEQAPGPDSGQGAAEASEEQTPKRGPASERACRVPPPDTTARVDLTLDAFRRDLRQDVRIAQTRGEVPAEIAELLGQELDRVRELVRSALRL